MRPLNILLTIFNSGTISTYIGTLTQLTSLDLSDNNRAAGGLNGNLPTELALLTNLRTLNLSRNNLRRLFPRLSSLTSLEVLDIRFNDFRSQQIPDVFGAMSNLTSIDVSDNFFSGSLPNSLLTSQTLQTLVIELNEFEVQFPSNFSLPSLQTLAMGVNFFQVSQKRS